MHSQPGPLRLGGVARAGGEASDSEMPGHPGDSSGHGCPRSQLRAAALVSPLESSFGFFPPVPIPRRSPGALPPGVSPKRRRVESGPLEQTLQQGSVQ